MRSASKLIIAWILASGLSLLGGRDAAAKSEFVDAIATHLVLPYQPPCRLCHIQGTTGPGTVATPFGMSMVGHGLTSGGSTVVPALDAMAADQADSDGDGTPDIAELVAGRDPNTAADVPLGPGGPTYGCAVASRRPERLEISIGGIVVMTLIVVRRRRSSSDGAGPP